MTRPLRILAFVPTLGGGGAEKHVVRLANAVDRGAATIDVGIARRGGSYERELAPGVGVVDLGVGGIRSSTGSLAACAPKLRAAMTSGRWDAVVAFLERPALVALAVQRTIRESDRPALLLSLQADPTSVIADDPLGPVFERAMRSIYRRADGIVAISDGVRDAIRRYDAALAPVVIANACLDDGTAVRTERRQRGSIVACGRLTTQKGFDTLVDAFAAVHRAIPEARLRIVGEGPDRVELMARIARLGLAAVVELPGFTADPLGEFARAELFCLSSRYEGLGMVLVEAMSVGTPVVSTDCPHGPREILQGGRIGRLVPREDATALADALIAMLRDPAERMRLSKLGLARAEDYRSARIAERYVDAIRSVVEARRASRPKSRS